MLPSDVAIEHDAAARERVRDAQRRRRIGDAAADPHPLGVVLAAELVQGRGQPAPHVAVVHRPRRRTQRAEPRLHRCHHTTDGRNVSFVVVRRSRAQAGSVEELLFECVAVLVQRATSSQASRRSPTRRWGVGGPRQRKKRGGERRPVLAQPVETQRATASGSSYGTTAVACVSGCASRCSARAISARLACIRSTRDAHGSGRSRRVRSRRGRACARRSPARGRPAAPPRRRHRTRPAPPRAAGARTAGARRRPACHCARRFRSAAKGLRPPSGSLQTRTRRARAWSRGSCVRARSPAPPASRRGSTDSSRGFAARAWRGRAFRRQGSRSPSPVPPPHRVRRCRRRCRRGRQPFRAMRCRAPAASGCVPGPRARRPRTAGPPPAAAECPAGAASGTAPPLSSAIPPAVSGSAYPGRSDAGRRCPVVRARPQCRGARRRTRHPSARRPAPLVL